MTPPVIVGVDPGLLHGALAAIDAATGVLIWVDDVPSDGGRIIVPAVADMLTNEIVVVAYVEDVHAMPKQGGSSTFKFGRATGALEGVLGALRIPIELVTPNVWKRSAGLSKDKNASRALACRYWPASSHLFCRAKDDGRAEAALIARHGWLARNRGAA